MQLFYTYVKDFNSSNGGNQHLSKPTNKQTNKQVYSNQKPEALPGFFAILVGGFNPIEKY